MKEIQNFNQLSLVQGGSKGGASISDETEETIASGFIDSVVGGLEAIGAAFHDWGLCPWGEGH